MGSESLLFLPLLGMLKCMSGKPIACSVWLLENLKVYLLFVDSELFYTYYTNVAFRLTFLNLEKDLKQNPNL